jgi:uncharacterized protein
MHFLSWRTVLSWSYLIRLTVLVFGLLLYALGIVIIYRSNLGLDAWDVFHQGISLHTAIPFGTVSIIVGALIIGFCLLLKMYPGVGTVLNMLLIGLFVDMLLNESIVPDFSNFPLVLRLLLTVVGIICVGLGTALYIVPRMGAGPRDALMLRLHEVTGLRIFIIRTSIEVFVLISGFLLGGTVGIGTLIYALCIGFAVEISFKLLNICMAAMNIPFQFERTAKAK